jgi:hypothetical protein
LFAGPALAACVLVGLLGAANDWAPLDLAARVEEGGDGEDSDLWRAASPPDEELFENLDRLDVWDARLHKENPCEEGSEKD